MFILKPGGAIISLQSAQFVLPSPTGSVGILPFVDHTNIVIPTVAPILQEGESYIDPNFNRRVFCLDIGNAGNAYSYWSARNVDGTRIHTSAQDGTPGVNGTVYKIWFNTGNPKTATIQLLGETTGSWQLHSGSVYRVNGIIETVSAMWFDPDSSLTKMTEGASATLGQGEWWYDSGGDVLYAHAWGSEDLTIAANADVAVFRRAYKSFGQGTNGHWEGYEWHATDPDYAFFMWNSSGNLYLYRRDFNAQRSAQPAIQLLKDFHLDARVHNGIGELYCQWVLHSGNVYRIDGWSTRKKYGTANVIRMLVFDGTELSSSAAIPTASAQYYHDTSGDILYAWAPGSEDLTLPINYLKMRTGVQRKAWQMMANDETTDVFTFEIQSNDAVHSVGACLWKSSSNYIQTLELEPPEWASETASSWTLRSGEIYQVSPPGVPRHVYWSGSYALKSSGSTEPTARGEYLYSASLLMVRAPDGGDLTQAANYNQLSWVNTADLFDETGVSHDGNWWIVKSGQDAWSTFHIPTETFYHWLDGRPPHSDYANDRAFYSAQGGGSYYPYASGTSNSFLPKPNHPVSNATDPFDDGHTSFNANDGWVYASSYITEVSRNQNENPWTTTPSASVYQLDWDNVDGERTPAYGAGANRPDTGPDHIWYITELLTGSESFPAQAGEWNFDSGSQVLYVWLPGSADLTLDSIADDCILHNYWAFTNEIYRHLENTSGSIQRLCHHHAGASNANGYNQTPRASVSRDGIWIDFNTRWDGVYGSNALMTCRILDE